MPWCPLCKTEYEEGTERCSDCGCTLTNNPPPEPEQHSERSEETYTEDNPVLLADTENAPQTQMAEGMLRSAGIPYSITMHNDKGIQVFIGYSVFGASFYVPARMREKALEAIAPVLDEIGSPAGEPVPEQPEPANIPAETSDDDKQTGQSESSYTGFGKSSPAGHFNRWSYKYLGRRLTVFIIAALVLIGYFAFNWLLELIRRLMGY